MLTQWVILILIIQEIFSSWFYKTEHFQKVHTSTGLPFSTMLFFRRRGEEHWISKNKLSITASFFVSLSSSCNPFREISFIWMAGFKHGSNKHPSRRWDSSRSTKGGAQGIFWKNCNASEKNNQRWFKLSQNANSFVTDRSRLNLFLWILKWNLS